MYDQVSLNFPIMIDDEIVLDPRAYDADTSNEHTTAATTTATTATTTTNNNN